MVKSKILILFIFSRIHKNQSFYGGADLRDKAKRLIIVYLI
jgi:hypothetical protein